MLIALIDRLTGLLRPATAAAGDRHPAPHEFGAAPEQVADKPGLVSPITPGLLGALGVRHALAVQYAPLLAIAAHRYHIDAPPRRVAAWLATLAHESARFTRLVENLNYSAEGLAATWPARYADMTGQPNATAQRIARKPEDIANLTYAGRLGNGSAGSGDGWRYRGRGLIQITGRANYARSGAELGLDLINKPEQIEQHTTLPCRPRSGGTATAATRSPTPATSPSSRGRSTAGSPAWRIGSSSTPAP